VCSSDLGYVETAPERAGLERLWRGTQGPGRGRGPPRVGARACPGGHRGLPRRAAHGARNLVVRSVYEDGYAVIESFVPTQLANSPQERRHGHEVPRDRKSTRLNSSHVSISYAVFCLKKKHDEQEDRHKVFLCDQLSKKTAHIPSHIN